MTSKRTKTKMKKARSAPALSRKQTNTRDVSPGAVGQIIRQLGSLGGGALGGLIGLPGAGASAGSSLGAAFSKWLGAGDYKVASNSLVVKAAQGIPMMHNSGQSVIIRHKEYLGQVLSSVNFSVGMSFPINPGESQTFPWLSRLATSFQQYEVKGMVYHYVPTSGSISSTQALGSVMIQTNYRANDNPPASKVEILNEYWANETVPYETMAHPIECDPKENPFNVHYVRAGTIPNGEIAMYDVGTTYVATSGQSGNGVVLGDLWVTYEVELKKPIVDSNVTSLSKFYATALNAPTSTSALFVGSPRVSASGNLDVVLDPLTNTITIPKGVAGRVYVYVYLTGSLGAASNWNGAPTMSSNLLLQPMDGYNSYWATPATASNTLLFGVCALVKDPLAVSSVTLPNPSWTTAPLAASVMVFIP